MGEGETMGSNKNPGSEYKKLIEQIKEPFKSTTQTIGKINEIQSLNRSISDFTKPSNAIREMKNPLSQSYNPQNTIDFSHDYNERACYFDKLW